MKLQLTLNVDKKLANLAVCYALETENYAPEGFRSPEDLKDVIQDYFEAGLPSVVDDSAAGPIVTAFWPQLQNPLRRPHPSAKGKLEYALLQQLPALDWGESIPRGMIVYARNGRTRGRATGMVSACKLESCRGVRVHVRWPDGSMTKPCSKGLVKHKDGWRID